MIHLKTFEDFKQKEYAIGDIVKVKNGKVGKIIDSPSNNTYIINFVKDMENASFYPSRTQIYEDDIINLIKANDAPARNSDIFKKTQADPSNDLVINGGYPDTPLANVVNY